MQSPSDILLVDDHQGFRKMVAEVLALAPGAYRESDNGVEAVAECDDQCPRIVVMDFEMPGLDGIEATRQIVSRHPDTIVILLTQHDEAQFEAAALEAGASAFLSKLDLATLPRLISSLR